MPRAFDPMQRARDFCQSPSPRRQAFINADRRLSRVESLTALALDLAVQPQGNTPIEILSSRPEVTTNDIGRQIIVQLPGDTITSIYVGISLADGTPEWQLMAFGESIPGDSSEFTFIGNIGLAYTPTGVNLSGTVLVISNVTTDPQQYSLSSGILATYWSGLGIRGDSVTRDNTFDIYHPQTSNARIRRYANNSTLEQTTPTSKSYNVVFHRLGQSYILATSAADNQWFKVTASTLAIANTVSTSINSPQGICEDSAGNIYVANSGNNTIRKYNSGLTFQSAWGTAGSADGQFSTPKGMWVDSADRIYVCDSGNDRIQVFDAAGTFLGKFGSSGSGSGQLDNPVAIHGVGSDIFIADAGNNRVSRWLRT